MGLRAEARDQAPAAAALQEVREHVVLARRQRRQEEPRPERAEVPASLLVGHPDSDSRLPVGAHGVHAAAALLQHQLSLHRASLRTRMRPKRSSAVGPAASRSVASASGDRARHAAR